MTTSYRRPPASSLTHAARDGRPRKTQHHPCPACGRIVKILPARTEADAHRRGRVPMPRRRQDHYRPNGDRCRYPATIDLPPE